MEDRKTAVETLHRERIMDASERLFLEKGFQGTTIADISAASDYSRRTIYAYFESKDEILCGIVARGLRMLRDELKTVISGKMAFFERYGKICAAMRAYQERHPLSASRVNAAQAEGLAGDELTGGQRAVLELGSEINELMEQFLRMGITEGVVRRNVPVKLAVPVLWAGMTSLLSLAAAKGTYFARAFGVSEEAFLKYGFEQLLGGLLETGV
ncbi:MAG: TetR/AcrR family transcriptional regulator [Clostridia bacterium]|nr:TetR/AcrR family transcriptional regulator [Clostridia bacterium]